MDETHMRFSWLTVGAYLSVVILLPFSRLAELPLLVLALMGATALFFHSKAIMTDPRFIFLSQIYVCYLLLILLSAIDSYWPDKTLLVGLASLRFYLATVALIYYLRTEHHKYVLNYLAVVAIFWALDAIFQYFVGFDVIGRASYAGRLNGIFGEHHAKLGPVLALLLPVTMVVLRRKNAVFRWFCMLVLIITIILSGTRSAWLMMLFVLVAYWFYHVRHRRFLLLAKSSLMAVVVVTVLFLTSPDFQKRVDRSLAVFQGSESGLDFALANRLPIWQASFDMWQKHPINGVGAHAFRKAYPQFVDEDDYWQQQGGVGMHAHHWILEIMAETGLIGLVLMLLAILKLIQFVKSYYNQRYSWAFLIMLLSAFLPFTSTYSLFASFWSICIWLCGAGLIVVSVKPSDGDANA